MDKKFIILVEIIEKEKESVQCLKRFWLEREMWN